MATHNSFLAISVIVAVLQLTMVGSDATNANCILLIGGSAGKSGGVLPIVEYYNPDKGVECSDKHSLPPLTISDSQSDTNTSGCYLADTQTQQIVMREGAKHPTKSMVYGLSDGSVTPIKSAHSPGVVFTTSTSLDQSTCLSCGGNSKGSGDISECYQFSTTDQKWSPSSSLPFKVRGASFVVVQQVYYIVWHQMIFSYATGTWKIVSNYNLLPHAAHSAVQLTDDEWLLCGGETLVAWSGDSCSVYNAPSKKPPKSVKAMSTTRQHFQLINFNGQIYAIGGDNGKGNILKTVEVYDKKNDSWSSAKPLKDARYGFAAFAVTLPLKPTTTPAAPPTTQTPTADPSSLTDAQPHETSPETTTAGGGLQWWIVLLIVIVVLCVVFTVAGLIVYVWLRRRRRRREQIEAADNPESSDPPEAAGKKTNDGQHVAAGKLRTEGEGAPLDEPWRTHKKHPDVKTAAALTNFPPNYYDEHDGMVWNETEWDKVEDMDPGTYVDTYWNGKDPEVTVAPKEQTSGGEQEKQVDMDKTQPVSFHDIPEPAKNPPAKAAKTANESARSSESGE